MKKFSLSIIVITLIIFVSTSYAQAGTITVKISGIKDLSGQIAVGLYNSEADFPETGKEFKGAAS